MATSIKGRAGKRDQIKQTLARWIHEQGLKPGDRLLGQNEFAERFETTAVTVHKALTELAAEGVIHRINGSGTFVGRAPERKTLRMCFVLPGEHLDEPTHNPTYWPYVQMMYRSFLGAAGDRWTFTTKVVTRGMPPEKVADDFRSYDGVFFHHSKEPRDLLVHLVRHRIAPVIAFGKPARGIACLTLDHDATAGMRKAVRYLAGLGYRRIAFVGSTGNWAQYWLTGYRQGLKDCGLPCDGRRIVRVSESREETARAAKILLDRGLPCDAILTDMDIRAVSVRDGLRQAGVKIPGDVGLMGYDGLDLFVNHAPYLTSVEVPYRTMIAAGLAELERLKGGEIPRRHLEFVGEVLPGKTTAARSQSAAR